MNTRRINAQLPKPVQADLDYLLNQGYSTSEIIREGIRLYAAKKRSEASA